MPSTFGRQLAGSPADPLAPVLVLILALALVLLAAVLLRRWQSRRALVRRLAELTSMAETGQALAAAELDTTRLAELVFQQANQIVDASTFQLGLYDGGSFRSLIGVVDGHRQPPAADNIAPGNQHLMDWLRETRKSLLVRDFDREAAALPARPRDQSPNPARSAVFVPLLSRGCPLGAGHRRRGR